jgi:uncharacterized phage infection (PIP) family protein YhgE
METLLNEAMSEVREDMATVARTFPELAQLLRGVMEHLPQLDPRSIGLLHEAAANLVGLPDSAMILHEASRRLVTLPDEAMILNDASRRLVTLPDEAMQLLDAARNLSHLKDNASLLIEAASKLIDLPDHASYLQQVSEMSERAISHSTAQLRDAVQRLESAITAISQSKPTVSTTLSSPRTPSGLSIKPEWYWKGMLVGWMGWLFFALAMVIVWLKAKGH